MPYLADDEEFKKQQEQQAQTAGGSTQFPAGGNVAGPKAGTSGRYANLNKYLEANKPQAQAMGENIAKSVEEQGQRAQMGIEKVAGTEIKASELQPEKYLTSPESLTEGQKSEYQQFKKTGGYTGPGSVEGISGYEEASGAGSAGKAAKAFETEEGRFATLQEKYARPSYQKGQQTLDQLLLQNEPTSKARMQEVAGRYKGLEDLLGTTLTQKGGEIGAAQKKATEQRQAIPGIEQKAWEDLLSPIQTRASEKTKEAQDLWGRVSEDIQDEILSPETMAVLGLRGGEPLYDLGLSGFVTPNISQRGVEQVATPEERSRYAALASLFEDPTRQEITAGGADFTPVTFDTAGFERAQSKKKSEADAQLNTDFDMLKSSISEPWLEGIAKPEDVTKKLDEMVNFGPVVSDTSPQTVAEDMKRYTEAENRAKVIEYLRAGGRLPEGEMGYKPLEAMVDFENKYKQWMNPRIIRGYGKETGPNREPSGGKININKG